MKSAPFLLASLGLVLGACFKPAPKEDPNAPVFRFTADFDSTLFGFEVSADFVTRTDDPACKKQTAVSASPMPRTKRFTRNLPTPAGTVAAPMAIEKGGPCDWTLASIWIAQQGKVCVGLPQIQFDPPDEDTLRGAHPPYPDTLDYRCRSNAETGCLDCEETQGPFVGTYRLDPTRNAAIHYRLRRE